MSWTDERVETLKKLWTEGLSASQIAAELGDVTRNAVIGKVHRLGLSGRAKTTSSSAPRPRRARTPSQPGARSSGGAAPKSVGNAALKMEPQMKPEAAPQAQPQAEPKSDVVVPISKRATILSLTEYTCKWPIGDPGDQEFHFCGNKSKSGLPYCDYHCKVAYQPVSDRRREKKAAQG
ncbi:GcrA family cell cycle regulator [Coralliovum pocilloporae]|uniref:GcrA family cell cycle regulator n=1 Tax=Coralliovum pocilloporae TaxID=3066369 RepID=UPI00330755D7